MKLLESKNPWYKKKVQEKNKFWYLFLIAFIVAAYLSIFGLTMK